MRRLHLGQIVCRWTVVAEAAPLITRSGRSRRRWLCRCICGTEKLVLEQSLRRAICRGSGGSRSCGCLARERSTRHGQNGHQGPSPEYMAWVAAKKRCGNPGNPSYRNYGGRGIRMCSRWAASFEAFLCDMGRKPDPTFSLDRIDPNGPYEPGNCRWASPRIQARNKRNVRWYDFQGERLILAEVAARLGITRDQARALERRDALPARRLAECPSPPRPRTCRGSAIDLNDVVPFGWPVLPPAKESACRPSHEAVGP